MNQYKILHVQYHLETHSLRVMGVLAGFEDDEAEHVTELSGAYTRAKHREIAQLSDRKTRWQNIEPFELKKEAR